MKPGYVRCDSLDEGLQVAARLAAKTVVLDVEPQIAHWETGQETLDHGVKRVLDEIAALPDVAVVCFATNARRRPSFTPASQKFQAFYFESAEKPFRIARFKNFPAPGVLIGDQMLTDGILARRLGYTFVHCMPAVAQVPPGPWLLNRSGQLARRLLFTDPGLHPSGPALGGPHSEPAVQVLKYVAQPAPV